MLCPADNREMSVRCGDGPLRVESCPQCTGVWVRHAQWVAFKSLDRLLADPILSGALRERDVRHVSPQSASTKACPECGVALEWRSLQQGRIEACMRCGGAWLDSAATGIFSPPSWPQSGDAVAVAAPADRSERWDRFSFDDARVRAFALPAAAICALVVNATPLSIFLAPLHIWVHEFGHAIPAWLSGYRALPLPLGWTSIEPVRSTVVYIAVLFLIAVLFSAAWREKLRSAMALTAALAAAQFVMTWRTSPYTIELWIYFSGVGGEFFLSAALIAAFYCRMPDRLRWDFWRYPVLFVGASTFLQSYALWRRIRFRQAEIPWGSIMGRGDAGGDMNTLALQYGWSHDRIVETYLSLGNACIAVLIVVYAAFLVRPDILIAAARRLGFARA